MRTLQAGILATAVIVFGTVVIAQRSGAPARRGGTAPAAAGMRVIASAKELMHAIVIPSSEVVFKMASEQPKSDADWQTVRLQSLALAESANLLLMPGRGPDATTWNQMAKAQMDAALAAVKAADAKNADALDTASNNIYETCDNCHNKYMKK